MRARRSFALLPVAALCASMLFGGCADTLQVKPIPHNILEDMVVAPFPVYWLGGSFRGLAVTEASHDASGAFTVQYGNCLVGGEGTCTPPLRIVTSPDNSFVPGGQSASEHTSIRGVAAVLTDAGRAVSLSTGGVVVDVYAYKRSLALGAASAIAPINRPESSTASLPRALPDTGFGATPLPSQLPATVRPLG